jgi:uncharacterized OB-fold protein
MLLFWVKILHEVHKARKENTMAEKEFMEIPGKWEIPYMYSAGKTACTFFHKLKSDRKIFGTRCENCSRVYLPPRSFCEKCFVPIKDWVEAGSEGTVETYTIVLTKFEGFPDPPYIIAYVRLDGIDSCIANFISGIDMSDIERVKTTVHIGMKVKVAFKDNPEGRITDFEFQPVFE